MSKRRPYLVADGAEVVVMRSLASTAFGAYNLDLPEGLELGDVWEGAAPGNTPGYVASLDRSKRVGGMFRRFMRADVHITVPGDNPEVRAAASDVEQVLDEARDRTSGEFFLESDITGAGLGPWVPLQDFVVGDTVDVAVFGAVVPMKVTRIEPTVDDVGGASWLVHVGGQLVSDDVARVAENEQVHRALVDSRRELAGLEASARGASRAAARAQVSADSAQSAADGAQSTADAVGRETQELREALSGGGASSLVVRQQLEELNRQLQQRGESAPDGLIPAYIAANTARWRLQDYTNELLAWQVRTLQESAAWNKKYESYMFQIHATRTRRVRFVEFRGEDYKGLEPNTFTIANISTDANVRVSMIWETTRINRSGVDGLDFYIKTGEEYSFSEKWTQMGTVFIGVTPDPIRPFSPSPPPALPRN